MKLYKYIGLVALGLTSCSIESPFSGPTQNEEGKVSAAAIKLDLQLDENIKIQSRANNDEILNNFEIYFLNAKTNQSVKQYTYKDMPEVVTLPAGSYKIEAIYGEDRNADWDNPYFTGSSAEFTISANQINTNIDPIACSLKNVMVTVILDSELLSHVEGEPEVEVYVNKNNPLTFKKIHSDNQTPGYFKHDDVSTLTATFRGKVDGNDITEIKTLDDIKTGNHYRLTFFRHSFNGEDHGNIGSDIEIDARVTVNEVATNVDVEEDKPLEDVTFPQEGEPETPDTPENPDDPNDPNEGENQGGDEPSTKPNISSVGVDLAKVNNLTEGMQIILYITSKSVITSFLVHIDSTDSGFVDAIEELLGNDFDLVGLDKYDGDKGTSLSELGFPVGEDVSNPREKDENGNNRIKFEITSDLQDLLKIYSGTHEFTLTVTNEIDTTTQTLKLKVE